MWLVAAVLIAAGAEFVGRFARGANVDFARAVSSLLIGFGKQLIDLVIVYRLRSPRGEALLCCVARCVAVRLAAELHLERSRRGAADDWELHLGARRKTPR